MFFDKSFCIRVCGDGSGSSWNYGNPDLDGYEKNIRSIIKIRTPVGVFSFTDRCHGPLSYPQGMQ